MIKIPAFPEELLLPVVFAINDFNHCRRQVPLCYLVPTQAELLPSVLDHYRRRRRMTDAENALPYGICFQGSPMVYITNGHHRWYVCRERGRKSLRMWVHTHPLTLRDALLAVHARRPVAKPPRRLPPSRQLPLALQFA